VPEGFVGMAAGQVQPDALDVVADPATDFEQPEAQGIQLHAGHAARAEPTSDRVEQPIGGGMKEEPELIGPEGVVTQAIGEAGVFEVLDSELETTTAMDVEVVEGIRLVVAGRDHKADIGSFGQDFGLDDHASLVLPGTCRVLDFSQ